MRQRASRGLAIAGFFWLVTCCCVHPAKTARPPVRHERHREFLVRGRITARTQHIREGLVADLLAWRRVHVPGFSLEELARFHIDALSEWLEEYMISMYLGGQSRRAAAETLNAIAQRFSWVRPCFAGPWNLIRTRDTLDPVQHHPPMPVQVLRALVATALVWRWPHLAVIMVLGFFGLLRPCELIGLRRQDVVLPSDSFEPKVLYLRVG